MEKMSSSMAKQLFLDHWINRISAYLQRVAPISMHGCNALVKYLFAKTYNPFAKWAESGVQGTTEQPYIREGVSAFFATSHCYKYCCPMALDARKVWTLLWIRDIMACPQTDRQCTIEVCQEISTYLLQMWLTIFNLWLPSIVRPQWSQIQVVLVVRGSMTSRNLTSFVASGVSRRKKGSACDSFPGTGSSKGSQKWWIYTKRVNHQFYATNIYNAERTHSFHDIAFRPTISL
jgi:hypothetical protein